MSLFRPCIDLHEGRVKQIVGATLTPDGAATNYISERDAAYFASLYRENNLTGGHIISLGDNNQDQVLSALKSFPRGLQYGGGVTAENAAFFIEAGASHVIVTSYVFEDGQFSLPRLEKIKSVVGQEHLVLDLSCKKTPNGWTIATDRWQTLTHIEINPLTLKELERNCDEFLVHSADYEGLRLGMDEQLIKVLAQNCSIPTTYAGGAASVEDLKKIHELSEGKIDLTIGSALDIFGGKGVTLDECINWNQLKIN